MRDISVIVPIDFIHVFAMVTYCNLSRQKMTRNLVKVVARLMKKKSFSFRFNPFTVLYTATLKVSAMTR